MKRGWLMILLTLICSPAMAWDGYTSVVEGAYQPDQKKLLATSFVGAVQSYLHRYEPKLVKQEPEVVKMRVVYDYRYDLELAVKDDRYEITVSTTSERARGTPNGRRNAVNLAAGLLKEMEKSLSRRNSREYKDRWNRSN